MIAQINKPIIVVALFAASFFAVVNSTRASLVGTESAINVTTIVTGVGSGNQTRGYTFTLDNLRTLTHLGVFLHANTNNPAAITAARPIGLWDSVGNLVASVTIPSGGGGLDLDSNYVWAPVAPTVVLSNTQTYTVGVWYQTDSSPGLSYNDAFTQISGFHWGGNR